MNIYITDGNNRAALAITRSLGKKGHKVFVGEKQFTSLAGASRYCHAVMVYPDPVLDRDGFIAVLLQHVRNLEIDVIIPVADITTFLVLENNLAFLEYCKLPFADYETVALAANKEYVMDTAKKLDIPIPSTTVVKDKRNLKQLTDDIPYPVVIKPTRSRVYRDNKWHFTSVTYANDRRELMNKLQATDESEFPILLQERIYGPGIGVFACYNSGRMIAKFSHRRLREKPPSGGVSVLRESIEVDPKAGTFAEKLLNELKWHGVAMVEFKIDERTNTPMLMEINGRFWGSLQLAIDSGVDFPELLIKTLHNEPVEPVLNYKLGVKTRWLFGDLDVLLMLLFKSRKTLKLPPGHPGKLVSFLRFIRFWQKNLHYEVLSFKDPKPFLTELRHWLQR